MEEKYYECELLIHSITRRFYNIESEDLYQAGCLGLIKAYKNYTNPNIPFGKFAYKYIFGEMYDLYVKSRNIKLNKYCLSLYKLICQTENFLMGELKRNVTTKELSEYLGLPVEEIEMAKMMSEETLSLDDEYNNIQVGTEDDLAALIDINDSINNLDPLSSEVIKSRMKGITQSEISKLLGISQVKVSRIESKSKNKILEYIS